MVSKQQTQRIGAALVAVVIIIAGIYQPELNTVNPEIHANLSPETVMAEIGQNIEFDPSGSTGDIDSFVWNFPDGSSQTTSYINPKAEFTFEDEGLFTITVIAISVLGLTSLDTSQVIVQNSPPNAEMNIPDIVLEDELTMFSGSGTTDQVNDIDQLMYQWDFGDGNTMNGIEVSHSYSFSGSYYVKLLVEDPHGAFDYIYQQLEVRNRKPQAIAEANATLIREDSTIKFNGSQSFDSESDINSLKYQWDFGDGITSNLITPDHKYTKEGVYPVTLTVKDDDGEISIVIFEVEVNNVHPTLKALPANVEIMEGQTFIFKAEATDSRTDFDQLEYQWGLDQTGTNLSVNYLDEVTQVISTVTDNDNIQVQTQSQINVVNQGPKVNFIGAETTANISIYSLGSINENISYFLTKDNQMLTEFEMKETHRFFHKNETPYYKFDLSSNWAINISYTPTSPQFLKFAVVIVVLRSALGLAVKVHVISGLKQTTWNRSLIINQELYGFPIVIKNSVHDPGSDDITLTWSSNSNPSSKVTKFIEAVPGQASSFTYEASVLLLPTGFDTVAEFFNFHQENGFFNMTLLGLWVLIPEVMDYVIQLELFFDEILDEILNRIDTETVFFVSRANNTDTKLFLQAEDHDGGIDETSLTLFDVDGRMNPTISPTVRITSSTLSLLEDQTINLSALISEGDSAEFEFEWNFGDGNIAIGPSVSHLYQYQGNYLIVLTVTKNDISFKEFIVVDVRNVKPNARVIGDLLTYEDQQISLQATGIIDTESDTETLRYVWDMGDGKIKVGKVIEHTYQTHGDYSVMLTIIDDDGAVDTWFGVIKVENQKPIIAMNAGYSLDEGNSLNITPQAQDSSSDIFDLSYKWTLNDVDEFNTETISLFLDDGHYQLVLTVFDDDGENDTVYLTLTVNNQKPVIFVPNFDYQGPINEVIGLHASIYDSPNDLENLKYTWILDSLSSQIIVANNQPTFGNTAINEEFTMNSISNLDFLITVLVSDNLEQSKYESQLTTFVDSDGDMWSDFEEINFRKTSALSSDTDSDFIIDPLEEEIGTLPTLSDSDGDGIWDGFNPSDGFGELTLGTNPTDPDTDRDLLDDGTEIFGWDVNIIIENGPPITHVMSNPFEPDSDFDGLSDFDEFIAGTNPMDRDSDRDGLLDGEERDLGTNPLNFDTDEDDVSDYDETVPYEIIWQGIHSSNKEYPVSDPTKFDSDNDGLSDFEERNAGLDGAITHAERDDTDQDGLRDAEEQYEKRFTNGDRYTVKKSNLPPPFVNTKQINTNVQGQIKKAELVVSTSGMAAGKLVIRLLRADGLKELSFTPGTDDTFFMGSFNFIEIAKTGFQVWAIVISPSEDGTVVVQDLSLTFTIATSVVDADQDDDLLTDGEEINFGVYGWTSDPNKRDSDLDGLDDGDEVMNYNLNPLLRDTDGDNLADGVDNHPKNNALLKVTLISIKAKQDLDGFGEGEGHGEIYAIFNLYEDVSDLYYVTTRKSVGTGSTVQYSSGYYFDIDDSIDTLNIHLEVWDQDNFSDDDRLLDEDLPYNFNSNSFQWTIGNNLVEIVVLFETILQPRVNTILINASTVFENDNGNLRYDGDEQFYIIYANVLSPLSQLYTILVPRSVFAISKLNSTIVDGDVSDLPGYLKDFEYFEDDLSNGKTKKLVAGIMSGVLWQFIAEEYDKFLKLLTTNSTDHSIANAVTINDLLNLGLDPTIVNLVPLKGFSNSETGDPPKTLLDKFGDLVGSVVNVIVSVVDFVITGIVAIGNFLIHVIDVAIQVGKSLLGFIGEVYEAVKQIVEILVDIIEMIMNFVIDLMVTVVKVIVDLIMATLGAFIENAIDDFISIIERDNAANKPLSLNANTNKQVNQVHPNGDEDFYAEFLDYVRIFSVLSTLGFAVLVIGIALKLAEVEAITKTGFVATILRFLKPFVVGLAKGLATIFVATAVAQVIFDLVHPDFEGNANSVLSTLGSAADFGISASISVASMVVGYAFIVRLDLETIKLLPAIFELVSAILGMMFFTMRTLFVLKAEETTDPVLKEKYLLAALLLSGMSAIMGILALLLAFFGDEFNAQGLATQYIIIKQAVDAFAILAFWEGVAGLISDVAAWAAIKS